MNTQEIVASEMMPPATVAASPPWAVWRANLAAWLNRSPTDGLPWPPTMSCRVFRMRSSSTVDCAGTLLHVI